MFVDDRRQYIYCPISKVSCTAWRRIARNLTEMMPDNRSLPKRLVHRRFSAVNELRQLISYDAVEIQYKLKNYFKFVFVRDPFERLVSAYLDKFTLNRSKEYQRSVGAYIVKAARRRRGVPGIRRQRQADTRGNICRDDEAKYIRRKL